MNKNTCEINKNAVGIYSKIYFKHKLRIYMYCTLHNDTKTIIRTRTVRIYPWIQTVKVHTFRRNH